MNDTIKAKIEELRQKQTEEDPRLLELPEELSFDLTEVEVLTLSNFALQRELVEVRLRDLDRAVAAFNRKISERLELDSNDFEIGFDDSIPNKLFARRRKQGGHLS